MVLKSQKALKIVLKLLIVFDIKQKVQINRWTTDNRKLYELLVNFGFMNPEVKKKWICWVLLRVYQHYTLRKAYSHTDIDAKSTTDVF